MIITSIRSPGRTESTKSAYAYSVTVWGVSPKAFILIRYLLAVIRLTHSTFWYLVRCFLKSYQLFISEDTPEANSLTTIRYVR